VDPRDRRRAGRRRGASGTSGDFGEILANGNESGPAVVTIESSDVAFTSKRCGQWTLVN
jgi:hypothetical protein